MKGKRKPLNRRYAGRYSKGFWKVVNEIPRNEGGETAYMLGVLLQDVEHRVLGYIEQCRNKRESSK